MKFFSTLFIGTALTMSSAAMACVAPQAHVPTPLASFMTLQDDAARIADYREPEGHTQPQIADYREPEGHTQAQIALN